MNRKTVLRIFLDIVLLYSAVTGSWWLIFPIGIICVWYYKNFYELPISALFLDIIYSTPRAHFFNFQYVLTLIAVVIFLVLSVLKSKVRKDLWQKGY